MMGYLEYYRISGIEDIPCDKEHQKQEQRLDQQSLDRIWCTYRHLSYQPMRKEPEPEI